MDRRGFLRGLISAGAAAVAVEFGVSKAVGAEIIEELEKDLNRQVFGPPKDEFLGHNTVLWSSKADIREFYTNELAKSLSREVDSQITSAVRRMQACIDADFAEMAKNGIPEGKVILEPPKVVDLRTPTQKKNGYRGRFELVAGSKPGKSFLGTDIITVGFIPGAPELIRDSSGSRERGKIVGVDGNVLGG